MAPCSVCSNLQPESLTGLSKGQRAILFVNLGDVKASVSAPSPCPECALIWNAMALHKKSWASTNFNKYVELVIAPGKPIRLNWHDDSIQLELFFGFRDNNDCKESDDSLGVIGPANHVSEHSGAEKCFQLASSWLKNCLRSHSSCSPRSPSPLPTRLLNVGSGAGQSPYLVNTKGQLGQYIALSYCWGDDQHQATKTTAQTLQKHKQNIEYQSLSKTLQDAILITRRLGIRYLWVDALCIIQGDPDDWAKESSRMSQIYLNAYLTISADNSPGCREGIFNQQTYGVPDQKILYKEGKSVSVRKAFAQEHDKYSLGIVAGKDPEPITCRAWTLQEALLSNRILRYTTREIIWECNEGWYCECGGASGTKELDEYDDSYLRNASASALPVHRIHEHWGQIVMRFTERFLTNEHDKLPALSGLATQFVTTLQLASASQTPDEYLAGLWRSNLAKALTWGVEDDLYRNGRQHKLVYRRSKAWRAPTWSWAAVEGAVNYAPMMNLTSRIDVLEAWTKTSTLDAYGQVSAGRLVVEGRVLRGLPLEVMEPKAEDASTGFSHGRRYAIRYGNGLRTFTPDDPKDFEECTVGTNDVSLVGLLIGHVMSKGSLTDGEEVFLVLRTKKLASSGISNADSVLERVGVSLRAYQERHMATWKDRREDGGWNANAIRLFDKAPEEVVTIV